MSSRIDPTSSQSFPRSWIVCPSTWPREPSRTQAGRPQPWGISLTLGLTALADALLRLEKAAETANPRTPRTAHRRACRPAAAGEAALRDWLHTGRTDGNSPG